MPIGRPVPVPIDRKRLGGEELAIPYTNQPYNSQRMDKPTQIQMWKNITSAAYSSLIPSTLALFLTSLCFAMALYIQGKEGVEFGIFLRDANAIAGQPPYYGALEYASSVMMLMSAATLLFVAIQAPNRFLWLLGILTFLLGLDDLFMLHEYISAIHGQLTEIHVYSVYAALLLAVMACYKSLLKTPFFMLFFAIGLLGIAAVGDQHENLFGRSIEDHLELVAFAFWATYGVMVSSTALSWDASPVGSLPPEPREAA